MSKLHIPGPSGQATACGRQLNNHRDQKAQVTDRAEVAPSLNAYIAALHEQKACRFCGRATGLLPALKRKPVSIESDDEDTEQ